MAHTPKFSTAAVNAKANALGAALNGGFLRLYSGTQPATADTAPTTQVLLAELRFQAAAFGPAVNGIATAATLASDPRARASGQAAWFRACGADGVTGLVDGSVGLANADLVMSDVAIVAGGLVSVATFTLNEQKG
jgi:hypothetical protein